MEKYELARQFASLSKTSHESTTKIHSPYLSILIEFKFFAYYNIVTETHILD